VRPMELDWAGATRHAWLSYERLPSQRHGQRGCAHPILWVLLCHASRGQTPGVSFRHEPEPGGVERDPRLRQRAAQLSLHLQIADGGVVSMRPRMGRSAVPAAAPWACRGIRGATTLDGGLSEGGLTHAVQDLLGAMTERNEVTPGDVAALIFTLQDDVGTINPAATARMLGFSTVPLLMVREHGGNTRVSHCLRALMLVNTTLAQSQVRHVYLGGASILRPDLAEVERAVP